MKFLIPALLILIASQSAFSSGSRSQEAQSCLANQMEVMINVNDQSSKSDVIDALSAIGNCGSTQPMLLNNFGGTQVFSISFIPSTSPSTVTGLLNTLNGITGVSASCKTEGGAVHGAVSGSN